MDRFIINKIRDYILVEENLIDLMNLTNQRIEALTKTERETLSILNSQLKDLDSRLERLYDALETGKLELDELAPRINSLITKRSQLERARQEALEVTDEKKLGIKDLKLMRSYAANLREALGYASITQQKAILKSFVEKIGVSKSFITIDYKLPMPPLNSENETIGVLDIVGSGRPCMSKGKTKTFSQTLALVH
jgi:site-specific DNA recombinase